LSYWQLAQPPNWRTPLVGCLLLFIQYIIIYTPYVDAIPPSQIEDMQHLNDMDAHSTADNII